MILEESALTETIDKLLAIFSDDPELQGKIREDQLKDIVQLKAELKTGFKSEFKKFINQLNKMNVEEVDDQEVDDQSAESDKPILEFEKSFIDILVRITFAYKKLNPDDTIPPPYDDILKELKKIADNERSKGLEAKDLLKMIQQIVFDQEVHEFQPKTESETYDATNLTEFLNTVSISDGDNEFIMSLVKSTNTAFQSESLFTFEKGSQKYNPTAIIVYSNNHYYTFVYNSNDQKWYKIDDENNIYELKSDDLENGYPKIDKKLIDVSVAQQNTIVAIKFSKDGVKTPLVRAGFKNSNSDGGSLNYCWLNSVMAMLLNSKQSTLQMEDRGVVRARPESAKHIGTGWDAPSEGKRRPPVDVVGAGSARGNTDDPDDESLPIGRPASILRSKLSVSKDDRSTDDFYIGPSASRLRDRMADFIGVNRGVEAIIGDAVILSGPDLPTGADDAGLIDELDELDKAEERENLVDIEGEKFQSDLEAIEDELGPLPREEGEELDPLVLPLFSPIPNEEIEEELGKLQEKVDEAMTSLKALESQESDVIKKFKSFQNSTSGLIKIKQHSDLTHDDKLRENKIKLIKQSEQLLSERLKIRGDILKTKLELGEKIDQKSLSDYLKLMSIYSRYCEERKNILSKFNASLDDQKENILKKQYFIPTILDYQQGKNYYIPGDSSFSSYDQSFGEQITKLLSTINNEGGIDSQEKLESFLFYAKHLFYMGNEKNVTAKCIQQILHGRKEYTVENIQQELANARARSEAPSPSPEPTPPPVPVAATGRGFAAAGRVFSALLRRGRGAIGGGGGGPKGEGSGKG
jgi:ABC-type antimicrobial peptide transport system ATPase subunit